MSVKKSSNAYWMGFKMTENKKAYELEQRRYNFTRIWHRRYNHMALRAAGTTTNKSHAAGKDIMTKEEFFAWCKTKDVMDLFVTMYFEWMMDDFSLILCPSIDRINPERGYTVDNIQWMTFSENCEKNHKDPITHAQMRGVC